jgi:hypothetical protein
LSVQAPPAIRENVSVVFGWSDARQLHVPASPLLELVSVVLLLKLNDLRSALGIAPYEGIVWAEALLERQSSDTVPIAAHIAFFDKKLSFSKRTSFSFLHFLVGRRELQDISLLNVTRATVHESAFVAGSCNV